MTKKGNTNALKHGGESAVKDLTAGNPLRGMASTAQQDVHSDYEAHGAGYLVQEQAERLTAVSRLFWEACLAAAQAGNLYQLDAFVARYGWLAGASLRAWALVQANDKSKNGKTLDTILGKAND